MTKNYNTFIQLGSNRNLSKFELSRILEKLFIDEINFIEWKQFILLSLDSSMQKTFFKSLDNSGSIVKEGTLSFNVRKSDLIKKAENCSAQAHSFLTRLQGSRRAVKASPVHCPISPVFQLSSQNSPRKNFHFALFKHVSLSNWRR